MDKVNRMNGNKSVYVKMSSGPRKDNLHSTVVGDHSKESVFKEQPLTNEWVKRVPVDTAYCLLKAVKRIWV